MLRFEKIVIYYEWLVLSMNRDKVTRLATEGQIIEKPEFCRMGMKQEEINEGRSYIRNNHIFVES